MSYKIEHRIGISAPAEVIWEILADIPGWEAWNPLYTQASGVIRIGEILVLTQALPGQKPEVIRPRVLDWVPYEQLHWNNVAGSGLVKTLRYMEIEKLGDEACIFSNGEIFAGLLGPTVAKAMRRSFKDGFSALSEAIKVRAESTYAAMEKPKAKKKKAAPVDPSTIKLVKPIEPVKPLVNFDKSFRLKKKR